MSQSMITMESRLHKWTLKQLGLYDHDGKPLSSLLWFWLQKERAALVKRKMKFLDMELYSQISMEYTRDTLLKGEFRTAQLVVLTFFVFKEIRARGSDNIVSWIRYIGIGNIDRSEVWESNGLDFVGYGLRMAGSKVGITICCLEMLVKNGFLGEHINITFVDTDYSKKYFCVPPSMDLGLLWEMAGKKIVPLDGNFAMWLLRKKAKAIKMLFGPANQHFTLKSLGFEDNSTVYVAEHEPHPLGLSLKLPDGITSDGSSPFGMIGFAFGISEAHRDTTKVEGPEPRTHIKKSRPVVEIPKSEADYKKDHSKKMNDVLEEAEEPLKEIRQRLNNLALKKSEPKRRNAKSKNISGEDSDLSSFFPSDCVGGKAGKPVYHVLVGHVEDLYKTSKPKAGGCFNKTSYMIDLHGHRKEEALEVLDRSLPGWIDEAMNGEAPFVIGLKIICGCGNQILSEVVEKWVKSNDRVGNMPKGFL